MKKSKVAIAKESMRWTKDSPKCSNCEHFTCDQVRRAGNWGTWTEDKNMRCQRGDFKTWKSCWCNEHKFVQS